MLKRGEVIEVLQRAREAGKTRYIGYSGDGRTALYAVECGAFDSLQISVSIADQEAIDLVLPAAARRGIGVIAKRPIANAAWLGGPLARDAYSYPYWERLKKLDYDFLKLEPSEAVGIALRFTLGLPGMTTAIVGTTKPSRWESNSKLAAQGPLSAEQFEAIRARWRAAARRNWVGQM